MPPHRPSSKSARSTQSQQTSKSTTKSTLPAALEAFLTSFALIYGQSRFYNSLLPALLKPTRHCALINRWGSQREIKERMQQTQAVRLSWINLECYALPSNKQSSNQLADQQSAQTATDTSSSVAASAESETDIDAITTMALAALSLKADLPITDADDDLDDMIVDSDVRFPPPHSSYPSTSNPYYLLDAASLLPVQALQATGHHSVLDMCAAPGGKTMAILQSMFGTTDAGTHALKSPFRGSLQSNEYSGARRKRLQRVIESYVPVPLRRHVSVTGLSALERNSFFKNRYDRILVDAPCSSERHLLHSPATLLTYSAQRTRHHATAQLTMLLHAIHALKPGGRIVYATCSLSPDENDGVVDKAIKKQPNVQVIPFDASAAPIGAATSCGGCIVLPDDAKMPGWGPLFYCVLTKLEVVSVVDTYSDSDESDESDSDSD